jgi:hypothetical protein
MNRVGYALYFTVFLRGMGCLYDLGPFDPAPNIPGKREGFFLSGSFHCQQGGLVFRD